MIELQRIVEHFLNEAVCRQKQDCQEQDEAIIVALNVGSTDGAARERAVRNWLAYYGVFQGLNSADRAGVTSAIVEFADAQDLRLVPRSQQELLDKFHELYSKCSERVRPKKNGTARDITSLTSKALWCCYPETVPLYDSYALRALWILSRLAELERPTDGLPYDRFIAVWSALFDRITIEDSRLRGYPYKVRIFDKVLWIIGQPDFGRTPYQQSL